MLPVPSVTVYSVPLYPFLYPGVTTEARFIVSPKSNVLVMVAVPLFAHPDAVTVLTPWPAVMVIVYELLPPQFGLLFVATPAAPSKDPLVTPPLL